MRYQCNCGNSFYSPSHQNVVMCFECGKIQPQPLKEAIARKEIKLELQAKAITCDCGNVIYIGWNDMEKKCYKCDSVYGIRKDKSFWKLPFKLFKDTLTIGDIFKPQRNA